MKKFVLGGMQLNEHVVSGAVMYMLVMVACGSSAGEIRKEVRIPIGNENQFSEPGRELSSEQEATFTALNVLQVSADEMNRW